MQKTSNHSVFYCCRIRTYQKMSKFILLARLWHVNNEIKTSQQCYFHCTKWFLQPSFKKKCQQLQFACHICETTQMTENDYHHIMTNHTYGSVLSHAHNVFQKNRFSEQSHFVKIYVHNENMIVARENIVLRK